MRNILKVLVGSCLAFFITQSYAIEINVHSTSEKIDGLGFTVDGKKHGGAGSNFQAGDMPKGVYSFGLRANGKDVPCFKGGKKQVKLDKNTNEAVLDFNGKHCVLKLTSR